MPTIREADGVALSSRNAYLTAADRKRARVLSRALFAMRDAFSSGERAAAELLRTGAAMIGEEQKLQLEYLGVMNAETLEPVEKAATGNIIAVAAKLGTTRLIDNVILEPPTLAL